MNTLSLSIGLGFAAWILSMAFLTRTYTGKNEDAGTGMVILSTIVALAIGFLAYVIMG